MESEGGGGGLHFSFDLSKIVALYSTQQYWANHTQNTNKTSPYFSKYRQAVMFWACWRTGVSPEKQHTLEFLGSTSAGGGRGRGRGRGRRRGGEGGAARAHFLEQ